MKQTFLRLFLLIITVSMIFLSVSCSEEKEGFFDESIETSAVTDFGGAELVYMANKRNGRVEINPWEESEDSSWSDLLRKRYTDIEGKYNIDITIREDDGMLAENYYAGLDWADIYEQWETTLSTNIKANLMISLNDIPGFSENIETGMWGTENALNFAKRGENYYGFQSAFHGIPFRHMCGIMYANKTVLSKYGYDVYEMIEDGKWTWSEFEKILAAIGNDFYNDEAEIGLYIDTLPQYICYAAAISNGADIVTVDENGYCKSNLSDKKCTEAFEWVRHLVSDGLATKGSNDIGYANGSAADYQFPRFTEDRCAFWCQYSFVGTVDSNGFMYNDVDFLITPCPCGPSGEYGVWRGVISHADHYFGIPMTANTDIIDAVLCDIYQPLGENGESWKEHFSTHNFLYPECAEMYYTMLENAKPTYEREGINNFPFSDVVSGNKTIAEALEANSEKIQATLDDRINSYIN